MRPSSIDPSPRAVVLSALLAVAMLPFAARAQAVVRPLAPPAPAAAASAAAVGLIVKLRDGFETAQSAGAARSPGERLMSVAQAANVGASRVVRNVGSAQLVDFGRVLSADEALELAGKLAARPEVEWAEPNTRQRRLAVVPNDPFYLDTASPGCLGADAAQACFQQWWLYPAGGANGNALVDRRRGVPGFQSAWGASSTGSAAAPVAVLDTGRTSHPDLAGRWLTGYDFVSADADGSFFFANDGSGRDGDPTDPGDWMTQADIDSNRSKFSSCVVEESSWHGTVIAGLIAAVTDNGAGVAGINQDGRIVPVRVAGRCGATLADIVDGIRWAAGLAVDGALRNPNPARIINISFGGSEACGRAYQSAVDDVAAAPGGGAVVVAAAGNEQGALTRPANCSGVIAVGAVNRDGFKTNYSNFGAGITLMTVGGDTPSYGRWGDVLGDSGLLTTDNLGVDRIGASWYAAVYGSSFSAPLVSGAVSLMLSAAPNLTVPQIIDGLKKSARPHVVAPRIGACSASNPGRCICTTATCGAGLLDAPQAVAYAQAAASGAVYTRPNDSAAVLDNADIDRAVALGQDADPLPVVTPPASSDSGGGGAVGAGWLAGLAAAIAALLRTRRRAGETAR